MYPIPVYQPFCGIAASIADTSRKGSVFVSFRGPHTRSAVGVVVLFFWNWFFLCVLCCRGVWLLSWSRDLAPFLIIIVGAFLSTVGNAWLFSGAV
jgi:hypothetical protein